MKKIIAGLLLSLILCAGHEAFAAFPSFVASAIWSSDLRPDSDYVAESDADHFESNSDFVVAPDLLVAPDPCFADGETQDEEAVDEEVPDEEKPEEEITTPTDMDENESEEPVVATPDEAGIDIEGPIDDVEGAIEQ